MHPCIWRLCWKVMIPQWIKDVEFNSVMTFHVILQCGNSTYCTSTTNITNSTTQTTCVWSYMRMMPCTPWRNADILLLRTREAVLKPVLLPYIWPPFGHKQLFLWGPLPPTPLFVLYLIYFLFTFLLIITSSSFILTSHVSQNSSTNQQDFLTTCYH